ncbi:MAG: DUF2029 domain-containing protein [Acidobacteria bacterium]|nr:DUF2029 domain-containing protein [Acidobacteriota bacterium]
MTEPLWSSAALPSTSGPDKPNLIACVRRAFFRSCTRLANLLTVERVALHAALLAAFLWSGYAVDLATPGLHDRAGNIKGADFLHFYTAGRLLRTGHANALYDPGAQAGYQTALLPESRGTYFVPMYGPQVYWLFEPLAGLPYGWAVMIWALGNCGLYCGCCYLFWRSCFHLKPHGHLIFLLALAYPGFFSLIAFGQTSGLALVLFTIAFFALRAGRSFLAGVAFGSLIYKPQLGVAAAVVLIAAAQWRVLAGGATAIIAQLGFARVWFGGALLRRYGQMFLRVARVQPFLEPKLYQMHSLRSFLMVLLPSNGLALVLYFFGAIAVLVVAVLCWRRADDLRLRYAALLTGSVLVAPHLWIYDLVIFAPALLLLADWAFSHQHAETTGSIWVIIYSCYALPLLGPVAKVTRVQISVIAFAILLWLLYTASKQSGNDVPETGPQERQPGDV